MQTTADLVKKSSWDVYFNLFNEIIFITAKYSSTKTIFINFSLLRMPQVQIDHFQVWTFGMEKLYALGRYLVAAVQVEKLESLESLADVLEPRVADIGALPDI